MAFRIPLQAVPNQSFSLLLEELSYKLTLKSTRGIMSATIEIDDSVVVSGARFFADTPLINYEYLERSGGNFILTTEADAIPDFNQFGVTQFLIYLTSTEIADARA